MGAKSRRGGQLVRTRVAEFFHGLVRHGLACRGRLDASTSVASSIDDGGILLLHRRERLHHSSPVGLLCTHACNV